MKPKVYIDKNNNVTVVFHKNYKGNECNINIIHDRGNAIKNKTNILGCKLSRFVYHHANAYGDSGHSSSTNNYTKKEFGTEYKLIKTKRNK